MKLSKNVAEFIKDKILSVDFDDEKQWEELKRETKRFSDEYLLSENEVDVIKTTLLFFLTQSYDISSKLIKRIIEESNVDNGKLMFVEVFPLSEFNAIQTFKQFIDVCWYLNIQVSITPNLDGKGTHYIVMRLDKKYVI